MFDYHMHTFYSTDGKMSMDDLCRKAIEIGLKEIAITDHMDINFPDNLFQIHDMDKYVDNIRIMQDKYSNRLRIKTGIEIGMMPNNLEESTRLAKQYPFDFIIASVHLVNGEDPYEKEYYLNRDKTKSYIDYYTAIHNLITRYNEFNVLGHLDYIRRYCKYSYEEDDYLIGTDIVEGILKLLIEKGKGIEVNTSTFRHESNTTLPHPYIIKRYRELGGEIITIGSDAHVTEHVGYGNQKAIQIIKDAGFNYITSFTKRKPTFVKI